MSDECINAYLGRHKISNVVSSQLDYFFCASYDRFIFPLKIVQFKASTYFCILRLPLSALLSHARVRVDFYPVEAGKYENIATYLA